MSNTRTYTPGYGLRFAKDITYSDYMKICDRLGDELSYVNGYTGDDKITVAPEPITEGGFKFCGGPEKNYDDAFYKTMRHHISTNRYSRQGFTWPIIQIDTPEKWRDSDAVFIPASMFAQTFLKAFDGASPWTQEELKTCEKVFAEFGVLKFGRMPGKGNLSRRG